MAFSPFILFFVYLVVMSADRTFYALAFGRKASMLFFSIKAFLNSHIGGNDNAEYDQK